MKIRFLFLLITFTALSFANANSTSVSQREGVDATINAADIADLLAWTTNSKVQLEDGLKQISTLPTSQRRAALRALIESVVQASGNKNTELLMRVVLNRALTVDDILKTNSQTSPEQESLSRRILKDSVMVALQVYVDDSSFLNRAAKSGKQEIPLDLPMASVGIKTAKYFASRAMDAPTHQATLAILKLNLGLLFNDLNKSPERRAFAAVLNSIAEFNKMIENEKPATPQDFLKLSRKIKAFLDEQISVALKVQIETKAPIYYGEGIKPGNAKISCGTNKLTMTFNCIEGGSFLMGSPEEEVGHKADEIQHLVTVSPFEIMTTPVTQDQWEEKTPLEYWNQSSRNKMIWDTKDCPNNYDHLHYLCPNNPVIGVTFENIKAYIDKLNKELHDGYKYRLPTEAEWEYAARGGTQTAYFVGETTDNSEFSPPFAFSWTGSNSGGHTHPVSNVRPNAYGLEMFGNVFEWVQDNYGPYSTKHQVDPVETNSNPQVIRVVAIRQKIPLTVGQLDVTKQLAKVIQT